MKNYTDLEYKFHIGLVVFYFTLHLKTKEKKAFRIRDLAGQINRSLRSFEINIALLTN